jgi:hypothetical protein
LLDGINADANDQFEAFLRSDEHRHARELRDGEDEVHIPVPEEDANVTMLSDFQPDPQELLHALQQGVAIHDGTSLLDPAIAVPRLQAPIQDDHTPTTRPSFQVAVPSGGLVSSVDSVSSSSSNRGPSDPGGFHSGASPGNASESADVRSVLQCNASGNHMILLHPSGTRITCAPSGFPLLVFQMGARFLALKFPGRHLNAFAIRPS